MNTTKSNIINAALVVALVAPVLAEEGGTGRYVPGNAATLIDLPPTKAGWVVESIYLHYDGDASAAGTFTNAGLVTAGLDVTSDAFILVTLFPPRGWECAQTPPRKQWTGRSFPLPEEA